MSDTVQPRPCPDCARPVRAADQSFCDACGAFLRWDTPSARPAASGSGDGDGARDGGSPTPAGAAGSTGTGGTGTGATASEAVTEPLPAVRDAGDGGGDGGAPAAPAGNGSGAGAANGAGSGAGSAAAPAAEVPAQRATASPVEASGAAEASGASETSGAPAAPEIPTTPAPAPVPTPTPAPARATGPSDTVARALLVPVPESDPSVPAAVLPGRPDAPRPTVRTAEAPVVARGGTPCPACGTANTPGRHFCRLCATPLVARPLTEAEGPYAGQRPRLARDRGRWIVRALATTAVVAVVVGGIFGGPPAARAVQDHFADRAPVHPAAWRASHSAPKQGAAMAGDGYSNTWWGTGYAGDSAGQYLEALFGEPTDLLAVLITPGSGKNTTRADGQATPRTFDLVVTDSAGETHVSQHRINDGGTQKIELRVRDAVSVRLVVRTAWRADPTRQVAVAELEFFGRSFS
ncbi:NADase-type glycan-binding domain-containing protein [Streptomyces sp. NPDC092046]|uniref:NADase-type glycan-binding domain-containing protein n=1 Tax=Streptomyces sp. NPDC092046 TaxID=3366009 RepID=UPI0037F26C57